MRSIVKADGGRKGVPSYSTITSIVHLCNQNVAGRETMLVKEQAVRKNYGQNKGYPIYRVPLILSIRFFYE